MLNIQNLCKSYGSQLLFDGVNLQMGRGEKLGLIGRNGYGKSTLFRILLKEEQADSGQITFPKNYRIGHLAQHLHFTEATVCAEACLGLPPGEEHAQYKAEKILFGLGFTEDDIWRAPEEFSGGFQIRINLAKLLVSDPDMLLLDEPTNYLDILSIRWITQFLRQWKKELILISHNRAFMDSVTTHTAMIHRYKLRKQQGPTSALMAQIALEEETHERTRINEEKQRKHIEDFISRFKAKASTAARAQSRIKMLEKMPEREKLAFINSLDFSFNLAPFEAKNLLSVDDVSFSYNPDQPLLENLSLRIAAKDRIALIGQNGRGKSTLLNILAGELPLTHGTRKTHPDARLGFFGQTNINRLHSKMTVEKEISNANPELGFTAVRNICGIMMFPGDLALKSVSVLSGGEKSRVLLGKILASPTNLLLLDEPTNHLDMHSIEALVESLKYFEGAVVIVTHDEEILRKLATRLVVFQKSGVEIYEGTYDEFLNSVGWEEEEGASSSRGKPSRREEKRKRAEAVGERSKRLTPLKKQITQLEETISSLEDKQKKTKEDLVEASSKKDVQRLVDLSKSLKEIEKIIEENFTLLEKVTHEYESLLKEFSEVEGS